jgi:hypothetical protein
VTAVQSEIASKDKEFISNGKQKREQGHGENLL